MAQETDVRQLVIFTLGAERYALPIRHVQEIIRYMPPRSVVSSDQCVQGVISLRGKIVPIYDLVSRLGVISEVGEHSKIVIVETADQTLGVIVDAVDEVLTVDADHLDDLPSADTTLTDAVAKIGDRLVVLLNPASIFAGVAMASA